MFLKVCLKHGEKVQMWLNGLKIAIAEKNIDKLNVLLDQTPGLNNKAEIEEGMYLLREAFSLVHNLKDETSDSMKRIKKNLNFLKSSELQKTSKLDIRS